MFKEERKQFILSKLKSDNKIVSKELINELNVSEDTIRRDLIELEKEGLLRRVHSGALQIGPPVTSYQHRKNVDTPLKSKLAMEAVSLLKEDSVIIIDGGTTNSKIIDFLPLDFRCTIITNSPDIANRLIDHNNIEVTLLGGKLYKQSMITIGQGVINELSSLRADMYIMGIYNISSRDGTSVPTSEEAHVKQKMVEVSRNVIALVSHEKLETISTHIIGPPTDIDTLIVDNISDNLKDEYIKLGIQVITQ